MKKVVVIMNEQHSLLEEQKKILNERFGESWEIYPAPAEGWTLEEQKEKVRELVGSVVVFASPIPFLMKKLSFWSGYGSLEHCQAHGGVLNGYGTQVLVFHNDKREKKELPNGRIVHVVAQTGWQLV